MLLPVAGHLVSSGRSHYTVWVGADVAGDHLP